MRWRNVSIASVGWHLGDEVVTSAAVEDRLSPVYARIGLHPGRLALMTGIDERRFFGEDVLPSSIATVAGRRAIEASGLDPARIGCLIHASVCRDFLEPATANVVHHALGLSGEAQVFDVSNACLGVMNGVTLAANMIELGQVESALVVAGENGRPLLDATIDGLLTDEALTRKSIKGAIASLTIGAGAAAILVARTDLIPEGHPITGAVIRSATEHNHLCRGGAKEAADTGLAGGIALDMSTDAEALLVAGVELAKRTWSSFVEETGFAAPDKVLTHQVGKAHDQALFAALGIDRDRSFVTYDRLGNVGSVSLPITLGMAVEAGFVVPGDEVALLGIGSGLSSLMMGVRW